MPERTHIGIIIIIAVVLLLVFTPGGTPNSYSLNDVLVGQQTGIDLVEGANITITAVNDSADNKVEYTIASAAGGGAHVIEDEGVPLAARANLDFVGSIVVCTDAAPDTLCTFTGDGIAHVIQEEGTPLSARANLNFVGGIITCVDSAPDTVCTITDHDGPPLVIEDEGTPVTVRANLDFVGAGVTCTDAAPDTLCMIPGGGGTPNILDLGDDGANESIDLVEFAVTGDTNSIFTEPLADKLLIALANNWPSADTADALDSDPSDCAAGLFAAGINAAGVAQGCTDLISETELDTEAELETQLTDVSNVFTNNDTIDISANTNLAAGRSLTLTGDSVEADAELFTAIFSMVLENPVAADDDLLQHKLPLAYTITRVSCSTDVGTATIQLDERTETTPNSAGTDIMTSTLVCDTNMEATTTFTNAGIAADALVSLEIISVATSPGVVRIHIDGTVDD